MLNYSSEKKVGKKVGKNKITTKQKVPKLL